MTIPAAFAEGRVNIAFNDPTLEPDPLWTRLDNISGLVASYTIDRGRQFETDRTDGGRATVAINDRLGFLDPANGDSPFYLLIRPLLQITLGRWNPVLEEWQTRFRGFISDYDYSFDPSQRVNRVTLGCVDIFEILNAIQMQPYGAGFGDDPTTLAPNSIGQVWFQSTTMGDRIGQVMDNCGIDPLLYVKFSGNVDLHEGVYSPGESPLVVITDAADGEFPTVANVFPDRFGRLVAHGRLAKFDPAGVISDGPVSDSVWDWHHWDCGDGAAVVADSGRAHIREFAFNLGLSKIVNQATATPLFIADTDRVGQVVSDSGSIATYGIRSWTADNLMTKAGNLGTPTTDLQETKKFAQWMVATHKDPRNRVTNLGFLSIHPDAVGAAATWRVLCEADISDQIDITVGSPGGGGFSDAPFFIEGTHETNVPLNNVHDMVTMSLDVSPQDYATDPEGRFPTP